MEYLIAVLWGMLGWLLRVAVNYYHWDKDLDATGQDFEWTKFRKAHDQSWVLGGVATVVFCLAGDWLWVNQLAEMVGASPVYAPQVGILIGFLALFITKKMIALSGKE